MSGLTRTHSAATADIANSYTGLFVAKGWPLTQTTSASTSMKALKPKNALGGSLSLGRTNTVLLGIEGSKEGAIYAVSGWKLTCEHEGNFYTIVVKQEKAPDTLCVTSSSDKSLSASLWCSERASAIQELASDGTSKSEWPHSEALVVQGAAMQYAFNKRQTATLSEAKSFAARLFPSRSFDGIVSVTETDQGSPTGALLHFVMRDGDSSRVRRACVYQGVYASNSRGAWNSVRSSSFLSCGR